MVAKAERKGTSRLQPVHVKMLFAGDRLPSSVSQLVLKTPHGLVKVPEAHFSKSVALAVRPADKAMLQMSLLRGGY